MVPHEVVHVPRVNGEESFGDFDPVSMSPSAGMITPYRLEEGIARFMSFSLDAGPPDVVVQPEPDRQQPFGALADSAIDAVYPVSFSEVIR